MEILLIGVIVMYVMYKNRLIDTNKFIQDNEAYFKALQEDDYEFLLRSKYGDDVDVNKLFNMRIRNAGLVIIFLIFLFLTQLSFLNVIFSFVVGFVVFKQSYSSLKAHYKRHLHDINLQLPYLLKSLEVLAQHYTIPVALSKSIDSAPEIFKTGLRELVEKINSGNSTIDPYMEFAKKYPVSDSIRMMRLLYRLGLGSQENKYEQLIMFSRSVSSLQNKARETKYKERLNVMENKTMIMLAVSGGGVMLVLFMSLLQAFM
jgi:hypothetical protein